MKNGNRSNWYVNLNVEKKRGEQRELEGRTVELDFFSNQHETPIQEATNDAEYAPIYIIMFKGQMNN